MEPTIARHLFLWCWFQATLYCFFIRGGAHLIASLVLTQSTFSKEVRNGHERKERPISEHTVFKSPLLSLPQAPQTPKGAHNHASVLMLLLNKPTPSCAPSVPQVGPKTCLTSVSDKTHVGANLAHLGPHVLQTSGRTSQQSIQYVHEQIFGHASLGVRVIPTIAVLVRGTTACRQSF